MRYIFQLLPAEPLRSQLQELRVHLTSLIGPNKALDYPLPHTTLLYAIEDNSVNSIQACDQLIAILPAIKDFTIIKLAAQLIDKPDNYVTLAINDEVELGEVRRTLMQEISLMEQQGQLSSGPIEVTMPHITLAQDISRENQALAREYIKQNVDWIPEAIEFDQVALLSRNVTLNQPYHIVARASLKPSVEQE